MPRTEKNYLIWLILSSVVVFVISLGFAQAPQPFKRLILFYAAFGLISGFALRWFADDLQLPRNIWLAIFVSFLVLSGGVHIGWQSYLKLREVRSEEVQKDPEQLAMLNMMTNIANETESREYERRRRALQPEFSDYLIFRVSQLGPWSLFWSSVFWGGELLLSAVIAGGLIFQPRTVQSSSVAPS